MHINPSAVYVFAPQGAGTSTHAADLAERFGCTTVVDGWDGSSEVPDGALVLAGPQHLCNAQPEPEPLSATWISFDELVGEDGELPCWHAAASGWDGLQLAVEVPAYAGTALKDTIAIRVDDENEFSAGAMLLTAVSRTARGRIYNAILLHRYRTPVRADAKPAPLAKAG